MRKFTIGMQNYQYPPLFNALISAGTLARRDQVNGEKYSLLYASIGKLMEREDGFLDPETIEQIVHKIGDLEVSGEHPELRNFVDTLRTEAARYPKLF